MNQYSVEFNLFNASESVFGVVKYLQAMRM